MVKKKPNMQQDILYILIYKKKTGMYAMHVYPIYPMYYSFVLKKNRYTFVRSWCFSF